MDDADVVIVGAGPVGLLLAAEVTLAGGRTLVLEREPEPVTTIKAGSINLASAELLGRRGLLDDLRAAGDALLARLADGVGGADAARRAARRAGHFAGIWLPADLVDDDDPLLAGHLEALGATMVPQQALEALLARHAAGLGVPVRRGVTVTGLDAHDDGVVVHTDAGPVRAAWVAGCDGGRSVVRHATGVAFPGSAPEITGRQAVADPDGMDDTGLRPGWNWSERGVYCYGPTPGRVLTVEFDGPPADRDAPVTAAEVQDSLRRTSGTDVTVSGLRGAATRWTDNARQAASYRAGRVLLAGDAAHVHSPFSGQGLNLGLGDAMNLGWKLGAVVTGRAPEALLDTYTAERHPAGEWVLDWTRAQVAAMRPEAKVGPLRAALTDLMTTRDGATLTAAKISGLARPVPLDGRHELVGRLVPDVRLPGGRMLREEFVGGRPVLLDPSGTDRLIDIAGPRVRHVRADAGTALLVRPDGVVAWAADALDDAATAELRAAVERWWPAALH